MAVTVLDTQKKRDPDFLPSWHLNFTRGHENIGDWRSKCCHEIQRNKRLRMEGLGSLVEDDIVNGGQSAMAVWADLKAER